MSQAMHNNNTLLGGSWQVTGVMWGVYTGGRSVYARLTWQDRRDEQLYQERGTAGAHCHDGQCDTAACHARPHYLGHQSQECWYSADGLAPASRHRGETGSWSRVEWSQGYDRPHPTCHCSPATWRKGGDEVSHYLICMITSVFCCSSICQVVCVVCRILCTR